MMGFYREPVSPAPYLVERFEIERSWAPSTTKVRLPGQKHIPHSLGVHMDAGASRSVYYGSGRRTGHLTVVDPAGRR